MMPILDTSFLVDLLRGRGEALALLAELEGRGAPIFTTPITALELYRGSFLSADPERSLAAAKNLLASLPVLPLDDEAAIVFGALARDRKMVTRDGNVGEVAGIKVVGW